MRRSIIRTFLGLFLIIATAFFLEAIEKETAWDSFELLPPKDLAPKPGYSFVNNSDSTLHEATEKSIEVENIVADIVTPFGKAFDPIEEGAYPDSTTSTSRSSTSSSESSVGTGLECPPNEDTQGYVINFKDVSFVEYLHFLSKLTNTNFVYDEEDVQFNVSIVADEPTDIEQVRGALLQILRLQGLSLIEQGNNVIISKDPNIKVLAPVVSDEIGNICDSTEAMVTRVFRLKNSNPQEIASIVASMVSEQALVEFSLESHHLIVTDLTTNVRKVGDLLMSLDNPQAAFEIGEYHVKNNYIMNLLETAEKILFPIADNTPIVMVPQKAANTIYVVSSPFLVQKSLEILKSLDVGSEASLPAEHIANAKFLIYKLQYHSGSQIEQTLQEVGADLAASGSLNPALINTINTVQWIQSTNSLLFVGAPDTLEKVKELLEVLDAPLRQVFIEVLAIRTTLTNTLELGVEYGYRGKMGTKMTGAGSLLTSPNASVAGQAEKPFVFTQGLDAVTGPGLPIPTTPSALGATATVLGNVINKGGNLFLDIGGLITALQTDQNTEVITNPKIVTQDTVPANFYVGSTRPFQTNSILQASGSSTGNFVTASIEYRQLGLSLQVTPYLGSSDMITLEIEQRSSDFVSNAVSEGSGSDNFAIVPVTADSAITTRVHIPNKHFLMISGMLEDVKTATKTGIPCLGGLPGIGDLFGTRASSIQKDNLIMFIRPHIIDTMEELEEVTDREDLFYRKKTFQNSFMRNSYLLYGMQ